MAPEPECKKFSGGLTGQIAAIKIALAGLPPIGSGKRDRGKNPLKDRPNRGEPMIWYPHKARLVVKKTWCAIMGPPLRLCARVASARELVAFARDKVKNWWANLDQPPYVVEFDVPSTCKSSDIPTKGFKGLLHFELVESSAGATRTLITYWKNSAVFDRHAGNFGRELPMAGRVRRRGQLLEADERRSWWRRLWQRSPWWLAGIGLLATLITNFTTIANFFCQVIVRPGVAVNMTREEVDVLENDEFEAAGELQNISNWVNSTVAISGFRARRAGPADQADRWSPPADLGLTVRQETLNRFVGIKPGATERMKIYGDGRDAGVYQLEVDGVAKNGIFSSKVEMARGFRIRVWPRRTAGRKEFRKSDSGGTRAEMVCDFMIGDEFAKGFCVIAELDRSRLPPGNDRYTTFDDLSFPFDPEPHKREDASAAPGGTVDLTWEAKGVRPHTRLPFTLYLANPKSLSDDDWREIVKLVTISFGALREQKDN
ncbi:MAG: hypothetical protein ABSF26_25525 [Thermoguttaceae bacterium]